MSCIRWSHDDWITPKAGGESKPVEEFGAPGLEVPICGIGRRIFFVGDPPARILSELHVRVHCDFSHAAGSGVGNGQLRHFFLLRFSPLVSFQRYGYAQLSGDFGKRAANYKDDYPCRDSPYFDYDL